MEVSKREMKVVSVARFKAHCIEVLDEVRKTGETVVVTKKGRPFVKLVPVERPREKLFGALAGKVKIMGDIMAPAISAKSWK